MEPKYLAFSSTLSVAANVYLVGALARYATAVPLASLRSALDRRRPKFILRPRSANRLLFFAGRCHFLMDSDI